ncbi:hypothetical protein GCM10008961_30450 [Deinococcus knuensis]|uniref:Uncharacterized protein n=1 Tax=Deinococcus knuensis TaxID=1837380 RepID=A0ABQ2SQ72_9DEIO|nr:hypothetical protein GCM10008961_30450 [Deinococcus knuensis]
MTHRPCGPAQEGVKNKKLVALIVSLLLSGHVRAEGGHTDLPPMATPFRQAITPPPADRTSDGAGPGFHARRPQGH